LSQIEQRRLILHDTSIPARDRYSGKIFTLFQSRPEPVTFTPKPISKEQLELQEIQTRALFPRNKEVDLTLWNPNVRFERQKDDTPKEVRELCIRKGIVSASEIYAVMSQCKANSPDFMQTEELSHIRRLENEDKTKKKMVRWGDQCEGSGSKVVSEGEKAAATNSLLAKPSQIVDKSIIKSSQVTNSPAAISSPVTSRTIMPTTQKFTSFNSSASSSSAKQKYATSTGAAIVMDFEDLDNDTMTLIQEQELLNVSLGSLSQKLSFSGIVDQLIESNLSQRNLNESRVDHRKTLEEVPNSDDDEVSNSEDEDGVKVTHDLELRVLDFTEYPDEDIVGYSEEDLLENSQEILEISQPGRLKIRNTEQLETIVLNQTIFETQQTKIESQSLKVESQNQKVSSQNLKSESKQSNHPRTETPCTSKSFKSSTETKKTPNFEENQIARIENSFEINESSAKDSETRKSSRKILETKKSLDKSFTSGKSLENKNFGAFESFDKTSTAVKSFEKSSFHLDKSSGIGTSSGMFTGFSFASGKSAVIKESMLKKLEAAFTAKDLEIEKKLELELQENLEPKTPVPSTKPGNFSGFGLASGKEVKIKEETLSRFKNVFKQEDEKLEKEIIKNSEQEESKSKTEAHKQIYPTDCPEWIKPGYEAAHRRTMAKEAATGNSPSTSKDSSSNKSHTILKSTPESSKANPLLARFAELSGFSGFATCSGKKVKVSEKNLKRLAETFEKEEEKIMEDQRNVKNEVEDFTTPGKPPPVKKHRLDFGQSPVSSSPFVMSLFKQGINKHSTPLLSRVKNTHARSMTDSQEVSEIRELMASGLDDSSETIEDFRHPVKKRKFAKKLLTEFDVSSDESFEMGEIDSIEREHKSHFSIADDVKAGRKEALDEQRKSAREKTHGDRLPMAGSVFMVKSTKNRQKMRDFVGVNSPRHLGRHQITFRTALTYKFSMENHVTEDIWKTNIAGISVGDNARLIMGESAKVGIDEIKWSFLASPGVDLSLVDERWIENAFKMLVMKFSCLENSFEKFERFELLSPENVLLQMKYRYDREIDKHQRSAIRRIVELDDVPCRRMVLKVIELCDVPGIGYELEMTDGWYSIRVSIDAVLADACLRGMIKPGTKLMTTCAEIIGCHGCHPLDMPGNVRLKIHANSTRRTTWHCKMGFCKNPSPMTIKMDSVMVMGGVIGKLRVVVTHVYPMIYVDMSNDKKGEFAIQEFNNQF
jgi:BRCA2, helical/BRCA2, oligonucleotide/oligosaccharide-binding, domain 1